MFRVSLILEDVEMPRTLFWETLLATLKALPYAGSHAIFLPQEDTAMETNWPRYRNRASSYTRGMGHDVSANGQVKRYFDRVAAWARSHPDDCLLIINMNPFIRVSNMLRFHRNIHIADGCLSELDRSLNPRSISMPAMPIQVSDSDYQGESRRRYLASFQGVLSHPVRAALQKCHDGEKIIIQIIEASQHNILKLDATTGRADQSYRDIMENADFAFIPRGDALFSYRLLEAMSFGCIPIILSDNWILPFDRLIDWASLSLRPREDEILPCITLLNRLTDREVLERKKKVLATYQQYFCSLEKIISNGLFAELKKCIA
ncbi:MAG: exostosin family protein [Alphaproteobacteria bacterium]